MIVKKILFLKVENEVVIELFLSKIIIWPVSDALF